MWSSRRQDDVTLHTDDVGAKPGNENRGGIDGMPKRARPEGRRLGLRSGGEPFVVSGRLECGHAEVVQAGGPEGPVPHDDRAERRRTARAAARAEVRARPAGLLRGSNQEQKGCPVSWLGGSDAQLNPGARAGSARVGGALGAARGPAVWSGAWPMTGAHSCGVRARATRVDLKPR